jgi:hypothetical protein
MIWPVDVLSDNGGEIAHFLPAASKRADTWWFVTRWLFGWDDDVARACRDCSIHGCHAPRPFQQSSEASYATVADMG